MPRIQTNQSSNSCSFHSSFELAQGTVSQFDTLDIEALEEADTSTTSPRRNFLGPSTTTRKRHSTMKSNYAAKLVNTPETDSDDVEHMDDRASHASSRTSMFDGQKAEHIVEARSMRVKLTAEVKRFVEFYDQTVKTGDASDCGDADDIRSVVVKMA